MFGSQIGQSAENNKWCKDERSSGLKNKKFFTDSDYSQSLVYHNLLPISFLLVWNVLFMLNKINNCVWRLLEKFKGPRANRSAAKQFLRTNFNWTKSVKLEEYFVWRVVKYANVLTEMTSHILTGHFQQYCFGNSWTLYWN